MKDSGVERIGKIPLDWKVIKLGKVVDSGNKYPIGDGDHGSITPSMYLESGIPYIRVQNLTDSKEIKWDNMVYISEETQRNNPKSILRKDDILIAKTGATVGKTCIIPSSVNEANTTSSVGKITVDKSNFDYRYVFYSLRADFTQDLIKLIASQKTAQPGFNIVDMVEFPICQPSKRTQEDIVNYLDKKISQIDDIISKQKSLIEKYKAYKQSLITETVTKGLNKNVPMRDSGIEWIGEMPSHWNICRMKNIGEAIIGLTYSPEEVSDSGTLVLRSSNVKNGKIVYEDNVFVNKNIPKKLITRIGDILICSRNGSRALIGKCAYIDELSAEKSFGAFMTIFRSEYNKFIYYILNSAIFKFHIGTFLTSTINQLTTSNLNGISITLPPKEEQEEIANFLDKKCNEIDSTISKKEQLISKLEDYKKSLIYECVTGKREVL